MATYPFYKRTLLWLLGFVLIFLAVGLVVSTAIVIWQMSVNQLSGYEAELVMREFLNSANGLSMLLIIQGVAFVSYTLLAIKQLPYMTFEQCLPWQPVATKVGWIVTGMYIAYMAVQIYIVQRMDLDNDAFLSGASGSRSWLLLIGLAVLVPIYEELFFRGYLYKAWRHTQLGFIGTSVIISVIFALLHGSQYGFVQLSFIFTLSMILCYAREASGSIRAPIYLHMFNNFLPALGLLFVEAA